MINTVIAPQTRPQKQPKGLYLLVFTEMWERFGFYTIQTIIILYMTKALMMHDAQADMLYAASSALMFLTPVIGGYIADRYLGFQRSIIIGGILFILAYVVCASTNKDLFFIGLSLIICANGFFKPSVSAIVGELYQKDDPRRDSGFTLFYMGINVGALVPPLIAGALVAKYGWHSGFLVAALGMAIGQISFMLGKKALGAKGAAPQHFSRYTPSLGFYALLSLGVILFIGLCQIAFVYPQITNYIIDVGAVLIVFITLFFAMKEPLIERKRMLACLILVIIATGFWSLYNQTFTSLMLFADRNMAHRFLGFPLDAEATQFFNPFFIITLSPLLSRMWYRMDENGLNPSTQMKFALGILFLCLGYFFLAFGTRYFGHADGTTSAWWLVISYLLQTIGELLLSPIGLAMITVLCPKKLVGMMMGVWFFAVAASFAVGGSLASIAAVPAHTSAVVALGIYSHAFIIYGLIALAMASVSFLLLPLLNRMIRG